ncbi:uncharacterized protein F5891DRAFT_1179916 [Suillus fuscotomentosus]|uniref:Uncharacterized protein n=1 Tax=Suillus fuscotomentosus TaxID=1912939 RepID=A0AAD4HTK2_9AGAM|nr:uncharacterized protein F5891DRAFT_1179916 [Suillus fuscotomentosus]KAG1908398.1 hypothetical protein F5891DRAFT_1179916 [Suillus fuscotomentosus]
MVQSSDIEYDTLKVQILVKISENLKPKVIAFENYTIAWTIPQTQVSSIPLSSAADYQFLLELAVKKKTPSVNLIIETHSMKHKKASKKSKKANEDTENDHKDASQDGGSENSESEDDDQPKKKVKSGKKSKSIIETPLNLKINAKISAPSELLDVFKSWLFLRTLFYSPRALQTFFPWS